jgi:hypothetical protein
VRRARGADQPQDVIARRADRLPDDAPVADAGGEGCVRRRHPLGVAAGVAIDVERRRRFLPVAIGRPLLRRVCDHIAVDGDIDVFGFAILPIDRRRYRRQYPRAPGIDIEQGDAVVPRIYDSISRYRRRHESISATDAGDAAVGVAAVAVAVARRPGERHVARRHVADIRAVDIELIVSIVLPYQQVSIQARVQRTAHAADPADRRRPHLLLVGEHAAAAEGDRQDRALVGADGERARLRALRQIAEKGS